MITLEIKLGAVWLQNGGYDSLTLDETFDDTFDNTFN